MSIVFSPVDPTYQHDRYVLLSYLEGATSDVYIDKKGLATIGVGFLISANTDSILQNMALGLSLQQITAAAAAIQVATANTCYLSDQAAQDAIDEILRESTGDASLSFEFSSDTQIENTFKTIAEKYENTLAAWWPDGAPPLVNDYEHLALFSLTYNGFIGKAKTGNWKSPKLREALQSGNRAQAWYEIRYNIHDGAAKRHYEEAALFGLYNDVNHVETDEALSVYRMFTKYRDSILDYDNRNGANLSAAQTELSQAGFGVQASAIQQALDSAKQAIISDLNDKNTNLNLNPSDYLATDIFVEPVDTSSNTSDPNIAYRLTSGDRNSILIAGDGKVSLSGGAGNDVLEAGQGNDALMGGAGNDTYLFKTGDGQDTIQDDSDGLGKVMLNGTPLTGADAKYQSNDLWLDENSGIKYQLDQDRNTLTITNGSDSITIDNFDMAKAIDPAQGYLGIHLTNQVTIAAGTDQSTTATTRSNFDSFRGAKDFHCQGRCSPG